MSLVGNLDTVAPDNTDQGALAEADRTTEGVREIRRTQDATESESAVKKSNGEVVQPKNDTEEHAPPQVNVGENNAPMSRKETITATILKPMRFLPRGKATKATASGNQKKSNCVIF